MRGQGGCERRIKVFVKIQKKKIGRGAGEHRALQLIIVCSNDDPRVTLTYFTARSNLVTYDLLWEKVKTVDFSENIAACDLKVGRCRQLIEIMKVCEY